MPILEHQNQPQYLPHLIYWGTSICNSTTTLSSESPSLSQSSPPSLPHRSHPVGSSVIFSQFDSFLSPIHAPPSNKKHTVLPLESFAYSSNTNPLSQSERFLLPSVLVCRGCINGPLIHRDDPSFHLLEILADVQGLSFALMSCF